MQYIDIQCSGTVPYPGMYIIAGWPASPPRLHPIQQPAVPHHAAAGVHKQRENIILHDGGQRQHVDTGVVVACKEVGLAGSPPAEQR